MTLTQHAGALEVTEFGVASPDGRNIAVWRTGPAGPVTPGRVAIVAPGFARRMRHMAPVARYLVENGFVVYRCDYIDHVGRSDGDIVDFTISGMYASLRAVHEHVLRAEDTEDVVYVAASLAARPCIRLAAEESGVAGIVGIFGVVNTRYTLARVFGFDHGGRALEEIGPDEHVMFEGKHINNLRFSYDWYHNDWLDVAGTVRDVERLTCPIVNICGSADDWISVAEVKEVLAAAGGFRRVIELPYVEHEVSKNPVAGQTVLREVTRCGLEFVADGVPVPEVLEPSFADLAGQIPYERAVDSGPVRALQPTQKGSR